MQKAPEVVRRTLPPRGFRIRSLRMQTNGQGLVCVAGAGLRGREEALMLRQEGFALSLFAPC